jgi:hypothetical protein
MINIPLKNPDLLTVKKVGVTKEVKLDTIEPPPYVKGCVYEKFISKECLNATE